MSRLNARPRLNLLTEGQKQQTHRYALRILSETGVRVDSPTILARLKPRVGPNDITGSQVRLPAELVEAALHSAPATIDIYDRRGQPAFQLGDGSLRFGIGVTALQYMDPLTDHLEPFARRHMQAMVRPGSRLPHYDVISTVCVVQDVRAPVSDLYASLDLIANTTRPLVLLVSDEGRVPAVLGLYQALAGGLGAKVFSPNTVVYVHEVIDQARRVAAGFQLDEASAVLDEIPGLAPAAPFLAAPSTRSAYKTGYYTSPIFPHWSMEQWQVRGRPEAKAFLRHHTQALIESAPAPDDHAELLAKGETIIRS